MCICARHSPMFGRMHTHMRSPTAHPTHTYPACPRGARVHTFQALPHFHKLPGQDESDVRG